MRPSSPAKPVPSQFHDQTLDYLREKRLRRQQGGVNLNVALIDKQLKEADQIDAEKLSMIKKMAKDLEKKAERDELVLRNTDDRTVEDEMAVNDLYMEAITAKLRLLDKI